MSLSDKIRKVKSMEVEADGIVANFTAKGSYEIIVKKNVKEFIERCFKKMEKKLILNKIKYLDVVLIIKEEAGGKLIGKNNIIKCNSCLKEKEEYVSGVCKECADKMDKHIENSKLLKEKK